MRQVAMFVVGFAVVAAAGVAVAQTALLAGDSGDDPGRVVAAALSDLPEVEAGADAKMTAKVTEDSTAALAARAKTGAAEKPDAAGSTKETPSVHVALSILHPKEGADVETPEVLLEGETTPGAFVWSGDRVAEVRADGSWSMTVPLVRGTNLIHVGAKIDGVTKTVTRKVFHGEALVWSITQKIKASETAFEKFHGTGSPGMVITASSPHGTASTTIGESGEWLLGVEFDSKPGTTFPVTVTTSTGWTKTYSFTHVGTKTTQDWTINHKYAENREPYTKFHGTGPAGTSVVAMSPLGSAETEVGKNGEWYLKVWFELVEAATVDVRVTNSLGFDKTYHFSYEPAEVKHHDFAVEQVYGSCAEDPPYDVFVGRTAPHTWVKAWSEYGWTKVESNADGGFEIKLVFEGAPFDTPFGVEVADALGNSKAFSFVRLTAES